MEGYRLNIITKHEWEQRLVKYVELKSQGKPDAVIAEMYMYVTAHCLENWKNRWRKEGKLPAVPTKEEWDQIHLDRFRTFHELRKTLPTHNAVAREMGICPITLRASLKRAKALRG
jgi:transposase